MRAKNMLNYTLAAVVPSRERIARVRSAARRAHADGLLSQGDLLASLAVLNRADVADLHGHESEAARLCDAAESRLLAVL
jgi:hypothetical protein